MSAVEVLVVTGGHAFDATAFDTMLNGIEGARCTWVEHPAAHSLLDPARCPETQVILFYDMCGIPAAGASHDGGDPHGQPPADFAAAIEAHLARGTGMLLMNHATVSWPHWDRWRALSASPFMLSAGTLDGVAVPGSGYRGAHGPLPDATVGLSPASDHPVLKGLPERFEITDELYLKTSAFETQVAPLLRADYAFEDRNFSPPPLASEAEQASWTHPPGSNLLAWANALGASPIVVSELGDGPAAYSNPAFATFVGNSIHWLASGAGRQWAQTFAAQRG